MSLSPAFLDELRARTSLSALVGRTVKLQRAGREWKACCPFHKEKTPSFTLSDEKGFYHCFGCGAHGDAIRWLTDARGLPFVEAVKEQLGEDGKRLQVLFVTVDPERDTAKVLANYVPAFDPSFLGLYGDSAAIAKVAKDFRVFYQKAPGKTPDSYTVDHTAGSYVFDPQGRLRLFARHGNAANLIADIRTLLRTSS